MSVDSVIGLQWGDEAKGKLVDLLTQDKAIVVRYQGGANAGHTVVVDGETYKLHHVPSGILRPQVINIVTPGVVIHPGTLIGEIDSLLARGIQVDRRLMLSDRAHVVFPWHMVEDRLWDAAEQEQEGIGTTLRGIGPCYRDKVGRRFALRLGDLLRIDLRQAIGRIVEHKRSQLAAYGSGLEQELNPEKIYREYSAYAQRLRPFICDTTEYLLSAVEDDRAILFEGAQGALLDVDHGTYPFVTSSNSSGVGISAGSGVPGKWISRVFGVAKCYSTRVGGGPFPTELHDQRGQYIRERGNEYGTTTGRPRRCGWFDAVAVRYSARLSGVDRLAVMMLDVLSSLPEVQICVAYELDGQRTTRFPSQVADLRRTRPIYETCQGWQEDLTEARTLDDLPAAALAYVQRISHLVERPVDFISVGPDRQQTIICDTMSPVA